MVYQLAPVQISYGADIAGKYRQGATDAEKTAELIEAVRLKNIDAERQQQETDIRRGALGLQARSLGLREQELRRAAADRAANAAAVRQFLSSPAAGGMPSLGAAPAVGGGGFPPLGAPAARTGGAREAVEYGYQPSSGTVGAEGPPTGATYVEPTAEAAPAAPTTITPTVAGLSYYGAPAAPATGGLSLGQAVTGTPATPIMQGVTQPLYMAGPGGSTFGGEIPAFTEGAPAAPTAPAFPVAAPAGVAGYVRQATTTAESQAEVTKQILGAQAALLRDSAVSEAIGAKSQAKLIVASAPDKPLVQPKAATYLNNPPRATAEMQEMALLDQQLARQMTLVGNLAQRNPALLGNLLEIGMKRMQLRTAYRNLEGLRAISNFELGDTQSLSTALSESYGRNVQIAPTGTGTFNVLADNQLVSQNQTPDQIVKLARNRLDTAFRAAEAERASERFKAQLDVDKANMKEFSRAEAQARLEEAKRSGYSEVSKLPDGRVILREERTGVTYLFNPDAKVKVPGTSKEITSPTMTPIGGVPTR